MKDFDAASYAEAAARAVDLPLPEYCKPGVAANLARLAAMVDLLFEFPLDERQSRDPPS